jgi:hypothetical protein
MPISSVRELVGAELEGRVRNYMWRKNPTQVTTAGHWFDLSMSPGNPPPKYWFDAPPGAAKAISQSVDGGIYHGAAVSPSTKYLRAMTTRATAITAQPMTYVVCDYLLYYPSCDDSTVDPQVFDNTVTLPRYTDGEGVQVIAVSVAGRTGGQTFSFSYTNSSGVAGRTSQTTFQNAASAIGTLQTGNTSAALSATPFIGLQSGDTGVRSIESVTMNGADVGLFTLILVKPLFRTASKEIVTVYEKDAFLLGADLPIIEDDAYISAVCLPQGTLAATGLLGDFKVIWN